MYRLKPSFTAGELSPLMQCRADFKRYANGCKTLLNALCTVQGPATRRPGFQFIYSLNDLGFDTENPLVREIPFIFNEEQAYAMIFFMHTDGNARVVLGTDTGLVVNDGAVCEYTYTEIQEFTAYGDYTFEVPTGATLTETLVTAIVDDVSTELEETTNFTSTQAGTTVTVNVASGVDSGTDRDLSIEYSISYPASIEGEITVISLPDGWDIETFDWAQSADEMYIAQPGMTPHIIKRYGTTCWDVTAVTFTDQPDDWSDEYGWPEKVTFHQQRLVFAATALRRQTIWLSKAGDFSDFGQSSPLVSSDSVSFTLDSGTQNKIQWLMSGKVLYAGTLGNEWTITGNDASSLTPENILAQRQTNHGSEANTPVLIGITTVFIERYGRVVHEFKYDYTYDSYTTSDMAILSPHITEHYSITDWSYQQTPDSIIWCVREDGALVGVTYQRQHEVVGWHRHTTEGEFKAITTIPGNTREDDVWVVIKRDISGEEKYYIEKMADQFTGEAASESQFLDSFIEYNGELASQITGLDHLEGMVISILTEGAVHPDKTVIDGSVTLNSEYTSVILGLPYVTEIEPMLADTGDNSGTSFGRTQRITKLMINFYKSLGVTIGYYDSETGEERLEEVSFRKLSDNIGEEVPLFSGWKDIDFPPGFSEQSGYFIRQTQPLPMTVRGITDKVEVHK